MRIQLAWLQDFVELPGPQQLEACLIEAGLTVDHKADPAAGVDGVVVVEVRRCAPHPRADRLKICEVDDGSRLWQVVCGAANVAVGVRAAHARPGATLPGGKTLEVRPLRGVLSHGMLCARDELGLSAVAGEDDGIWLLGAEAPLGAAALGQAPSPAVWTLSVTPNRPDLLCHLGVAREVAASSGRRLRPPKPRAPEKGPDIGTLARVQVEEPLATRRYLARVVRNLRVAPSPPWAARRLADGGVRAVNNVVDATLLACLEQGVPLHAYDLGRLGCAGATPRLIVRRPQPGETLRGLDGGLHALAGDDIIVADPSGPVALAGIVGGQASAVHAATTSILLEAAVIDAARLRATSRRLGVRTESSLRGERGVDPQQAQRALDRACQLIAEWAGGDVAKGVLEHVPALARAEVPLRPARVARILGVALAPEALVQLLEPLEIRCITRTDQALIFEVPSFRPDITREVDLIEEVARRYGLGRLPARRPSTGGPLVFAARREARRPAVRGALLAAGLSECVSLAFGRSDAYGSEAIPLRNPLGQAHGVLRTSLLPGLLGAVAGNLARGRRDLRLFEMGVTFHHRRPHPEEDARQRLLPLEVERVAWCLWGGRAGGGWWQRDEAVDISDLMAVAEVLVEAVRPAQRLRAVPGQVAGFAADGAAELWLGDTLLGVAGHLTPAICARHGLGRPILAGELSLTTLAQQRPASRQVPPLSLHPSVRRDVAWLAPAELPAAVLAEALWAHAGGELGGEVIEAVRLFDRYVGAPVPGGKVSLGFAVDYRHASRTLTDAEVGRAFSAALDRIARDHPVVVR